MGVPTCLQYYLYNDHHHHHHDEAGRQQEKIIRKQPSNRNWCFLKNWRRSRFKVVLCA
jgi:hypothetical protein